MSSELVRIYLVIDSEVTAESPLGLVVEAFVDREYALSFIEMAHDHAHPRADFLRIEEVEATRATPSSR